MQGPIGVAIGIVYGCVFGLVVSKILPSEKSVRIYFQILRFVEKK